MSSSSKSGRELVYAIYHAYQLCYLPWLFMLSLYKAHKAEPSSYSLTIPTVRAYPEYQAED